MKWKMLILPLIALTLSGCGWIDQIQSRFSTSATTESKSPRNIDIEQLQQSLKAGITEDDLIALVGAPDGEIIKADKKFLSYRGTLVTVQNGVVVTIPSQFIETVLIAPDTQSDTVKPQQDLNGDGMVFHEGQWVSPQFRDSKIAAAKAAQNRREKSAPGKKAQQNSTERITSGHIIHRNNGRPVDHNHLINLGDTTVLFFYSESQNPALNRTLSDQINALIQNNHTMELRKIDVQSTLSEKALRYGIDTLPEVRVFDRRKRLIGKPSQDFRDIQQYIHYAETGR